MLHQPRWSLISYSRTWHINDQSANVKYLAYVSLSISRLCARLLDVSFWEGWAHWTFDVPETWSFRGVRLYWTFLTTLGSHRSQVAGFFHISRYDMPTAFDKIIQELEPKTSKKPCIHCFCILSLSYFLLYLCRCEMMPLCLEFQLQTGKKTLHEMVAKY